jgi:hypothetical protein
MSNTQERLIPYELYVPSPADAPDILIDEALFKEPAVLLGIKNNAVSGAWNSMMQGSDRFFDSIDELATSPLELIDTDSYLGYYFGSEFYNIPDQDRERYKKLMDIAKGDVLWQSELWTSRDTISFNVLKTCVEINPEAEACFKINVSGKGRMQYVREVVKYVEDMDAKRKDVADRFNDL